MDCSITACLTWLTVGFVGFAILFRIFRKRIFAAFCSNMSKGPMLRAEKKKLFQSLNEAAMKAGPGKLRVQFNCRYDMEAYIINQKKYKGEIIIFLSFILLKDVQSLL